MHVISYQISKILLSSSFTNLGGWGGVTHMMTVKKSDGLEDSNLFQIKLE